MNAYMKVIGMVVLVAVLLVACSAGGPSNKSLTEILYGVYFRKV
jgi:hypothetical protein